MKECWINVWERFPLPLWAEKRHSVRDAAVCYDHAARAVGRDRALYRLHVRLKEAA